MEKASGQAARSVSRGLGETVARAVAIAAQMALLCPGGSDELIRRELAGKADGRAPGERRSR